MLSLDVSSSTGVLTAWWSYHGVTAECSLRQLYMESSEADHFLAMVGTESIWLSYADDVIAFVGENVNCVDMLNSINAVEPIIVYFRRGTGWKAFFPGESGLAFQQFMYYTQVDSSEVVFNTCSGEASGFNAQWRGRG